MIVLPLAAENPAGLVLVQWRAWEVQVPNYDAPSWHLVGILSKENLAKVSSALAQVASTGDEARSKTGSIYLLSNPPGTDENAARLWKSWQRQHRVILLRDVTAEVLAGRQPRPLRLIRQSLVESTADSAISLRGHRKW
jgi:hypothetical protein